MLTTSWFTTGTISWYKNAYSKFRILPEPNFIPLLIT